MEVVDQPIGPLAPLPRGQATFLQGEQQVVAHAEGAEHTGLLGQIADAQTGPQGHGQRRNALAVHHHLAGIGTQQPRHQVEGGGLAGAVGAQQRGDAAVERREPDVLDRDDARAAVEKLGRAAALAPVRAPLLADLANRVGAKLLEWTRRRLPQGYDVERDFRPRYGPWEQRLCLVPDADFFEAIKAGKADVVTDHIEKFDKTGITLKSGKHLDADIIVTATGLKLAVAGKIAVSVDGAPVDFSKRFYYRNCMFSNVPNLAAVFGYLNASWTLRVDIIGDYLTRLLNQMDAIHAQAAVPVLPEGQEPEEDDIFDFSSGYIQRGKHLMPKNAPALPWRLNQEYRKDRQDMRQAPLDDGVMQFRRVQDKVSA